MGNLSTCGFPATILKPLAKPVEKVAIPSKEGADKGRSVEKVAVSSKGRARDTSTERTAAGHRQPVSRRPSNQLPEDAADAGLTQREQDVLYYFSMGHSAKKIAEALFVSYETVRTHTTNLYRKLDVHSKQELIDLVSNKGQE